ncbi:MAG TPA: dipeptide epimerase, partial [Rhizobiaceae bacterium]|nr:dipeptide epimerase [Rhizobiaceae bacterium]
MTHSRLSITTAVERFPIRGQFRISRGAKTEAEVVTCRVSGGGFTGIGECVPYRRYGETVESVRDQIAGLDALSLGDNPREALRAAMKPGAARNALDCAFWDLEAKTSRVPAHSLACRLPPRPVPTALTISLDTPANMAEAARAAADRPLLKIKVDGEKPVACMHAVASSAPRARIIVDANEAWDENTIVDLLRAAG